MTDEPKFFTRKLQPVPEPKPITLGRVIDLLEAEGKGDPKCPACLGRGWFPDSEDGGIPTPCNCPANIAAARK